MMKKLISFIAILLAVINLFAGDKVYNTLTSSLKANNTKLQASYEDLKKAKLDTKDAKANYHPNIDLTVSGSYIINPIGPITINASELGLPYNQYITLYKGMEDTLYQTSLSLQQPIFTWGKIKNGVNALTEVESVRSLQITDTENQLTAELKTRLAANYYMDEIITLLNEQKSYADRLVQIAYAANEQGIMLLQEVKENEIEALSDLLSFKEYCMCCNELLNISINEYLENVE